MADQHLGVQISPSPSAAPSQQQTFALPNDLNFTPIYGNALAASDSHLALLMERAATSGSDSTMKLIETSKSVLLIVDVVETVRWGQLVAQLIDLPPSPLICAAWNDDSSMLAVASKAALYIVRPGQPSAAVLARMPLFFIPSSLSWDPLNAGWLLGGAGGLVLCSLQSDRRVHAESLLSGRWHAAVQIASPSKPTMILGLMDGRVCSYTRSSQSPAEPIPFETLQVSRIACVAYSAHTQVLAVSSSAGQILLATRVHSLSDEADALEGTRPPPCVLFSPSGTHIIFSDTNSTPLNCKLLIREVASPSAQPIPLFSATSPIRSIAVSDSVVWICEAKRLHALWLPVDILIASNSGISLCPGAALSWSNRTPHLTIQTPTLTVTSVPFLPLSLLRRYCACPRFAGAVAPSTRHPPLSILSQTHFVTFFEHSIWIFTLKTAHWTCVVSKHVVHSLEIARITGDSLWLLACVSTKGGPAALELIDCTHGSTRTLLTLQANTQWMWLRRALASAGSTFALVEESDTGALTSRAVELGGGDTFDALLVRCVSHAKHITRTEAK